MQCIHDMSVTAEYFAVPLADMWSNTMYNFPSSLSDECLLCASRRFLQCPDETAVWICVSETFTQKTGILNIIKCQRFSPDQGWVIEDGQMDQSSYFAIWMQFLFSSSGRVCLSRLSLFTLMTNTGSWHFWAVLCSSDQRVVPTPLSLFKNIGFCRMFSFMLEGGFFFIFSLTVCTYAWATNLPRPARDRIGEWLQK